MTKFLVAGVLGLVLMATAGTQTASAAVWRGGGYRGHVYAHPGFRTVERNAFVRPHVYGYNHGYNRCW